LHLINADGTDLRLILDAEWRPEALDWSPDGSRIVVTVRRYSTREPFLYSVKPDGSGGQALTDQHGNSEDLDWAPSPGAAGDTSS
jgi:hypothetical protein